MIQPAVEELKNVPKERKKDLDTINHWHKTAAKAESLQQFEESMENR